MLESQIKVLICDDHTLFREGVKASLSVKPRIKFVGEAVDGKDLLNKLNYLTPDVILLDINMPGLDGLGVLPILKSNDRYKNIKVIILSMHKEMGMVSKMMSLGANSYLTKNDDISTIYDAIVTCYEKEYYFSELTNKSLLNTVIKAPASIIEDDDYRVIENKRKYKEVIYEKRQTEIKNNNKKNNYDIVWKIILRGIITGVVGGAILFLILYFIKNINNNLDITKNFNL